MDSDRIPKSVRTDELTSFCERYEAICREGATEGHFQKVQVESHKWNSFWRRYHDLQWQQYEAFLAGRLTSEIYEPWLRQRRIDWNKGFWRVKSVALQLSCACKNNLKKFAIDSSAEFIVDASKKELLTHCSTALQTIEDLAEIESGRVGYRIVGLSQQDHHSEEDFAELMLKESEGCIREQEMYSFLESTLKDIFSLVAGSGKNRLEKSIQMSLDEQRAYREGWRAVMFESVGYMKSFIVDVRAIMMSETDARIRLVLEDPVE